MRDFAFRVWGFVFGVSQVRGYRFLFLRFEVTGTRFPDQGYEVRGFGYGFSRFGISGSGFRVLSFEVRGFAVFEVRDFRYGLPRFGDSGTCFAIGVGVRGFQVLAFQFRVSTL